MTKPSFDLSSIKVRVFLRMKRTTSCTGVLYVGLVNSAANNTVVVAQPSTAMRPIVVSDYTADVWHEIELFFTSTFIAPAWEIFTGGLATGEGAERISGGSVYVSDFEVQRSAPLPSIEQRSASGAYTLRLEDNGKHVYISTGGVTIPPNSSVPFDLGAAVTVVNNSGSTQTLSQGSGVTLRLSGTATTGNRTLAAYGVATLLKVATDTWMVVGNIS